ncbi:MAG TPA: hypothetical protein VGS23_04675 [Thermoplasmata archaeon]|nr:hypothetical protein [Thermoplasmata archaeon]
MSPSTRRPAERPAGRSADELARVRRTRALEEALDVRPRPGTLCARFEVRNLRHATRYSVFLPEFPRQGGALCNCTDFGRRGLGTCKHIESVVLWISEHPKEGAAVPLPFDGRSVWSRIDPAVERLASRGRVDPRGVRVPGALLFERGRRLGGSAS